MRGRGLWRWSCGSVNGRHRWPRRTRHWYRHRRGDSRVGAKRRRSSKRSERGISTRRCVRLLMALRVRSRLRAFSALPPEHAGELSRRNGQSMPAGRNHRDRGHVFFRQLLLAALHWMRNALAYVPKTQQSMAAATQTSDLNCQRCCAEPRSKQLSLTSSNPLTFTAKAN